jgi:hypothetical protein
MTKKFFYLMVLICGLSLFSSAKQIGLGVIKEYQETKPANTKKKPCKTKKVITANLRPFNFYLFNI